MAYKQLTFEAISCVITWLRLFTICFWWL